MVASLIMLHLYDKIPTESTPIIKNKLNKLDKLGLAKVVLRLPLVKLYHVGLVFWVGSVILGIFGVGRFMIGDRILGILRALLFVLSYCTLISLPLINHLLPELELLPMVLTIVGYSGLVLVGLWWIADIVVITSTVKKKNLNKLLMLFQLQ